MELTKELTRAGVTVTIRDPNLHTTAATGETVIFKESVTIYKFRPLLRLHILMAKHRLRRLWRIAKNHKFSNYQ